MKWTKWWVPHLEIHHKTYIPKFSLTMNHLAIIILEKLTGGSDAKYTIEIEVCEVATCVAERWPSSMVSSGFCLSSQIEDAFFFCTLKIKSL